MCVGHVISTLPGPHPKFVTAALNFGCVCKFNAHEFARVVRTSNGDF